MRKLKPTEISSILPGRLDDVRTMLSNLLTRITKDCPVTKELITKLACNPHRPNEDLTNILNNLEVGMDLNLDLTPNSLFLSSDIGMKLNPSNPIDFMGKKSLKCKAVITSTDSYFCFNDQWCQVDEVNEINTSLQDVDVFSNVRMASYEADSEDLGTHSCLTFLTLKPRGAVSTSVRPSSRKFPAMVSSPRRRTPSFTPSLPRSLRRMTSLPNWRRSSTSFRTISPGLRLLSPSTLQATGSSILKIQMKNTEVAIVAYQGLKVKYPGLEIDKNEK